MPGISVGQPVQVIQEQHSRNNANACTAQLCTNRKKLLCGPHLSLQSIAAERCDCRPGSDTKQQRQTCLPHSTLAELCTHACPAIRSLDSDGEVPLKLFHSCSTAVANATPAVANVFICNKLTHKCPNHAPVSGMLLLTSCHLRAASRCRQHAPSTHIYPLAHSRCSSRLCPAHNMHHHNMACHSHSLLS